METYQVELILTYHALFTALLRKKIKISNFTLIWDHLLLILSLEKDSFHRFMQIKNV